MLIITSAVTLLPMLMGALLWAKLPQQLAIHWNAQGVADGVASRTLVVFGFPVIFLVIHLAGIALTLFEHKNRNMKKKPFLLMLWLCPMLSLVVFSVVYSIALGFLLRVEVMAPLLLGIMFIVIGNYMPKIEKNRTLGIKLPWTLKSEKNWYKTHRLAGALWVAGGVLILATAFLGNMLITFSALIAMVLIPTVYSYVLYKGK